MAVCVYKGEGESFICEIVDSRKINAFLAAGYRLTEEVESNPEPVHVDEVSEESKDPLAARKRGRTKKS